MRIPATLAAAATSVVLAVSGVALLPAAAASAETPAASGSSLSPGVERESADLAKGRTVRVIATFKAAGGIGKSPDTASIKSARGKVLAALPKGSYETVASFSRIPAVSLEVDAAALDALATDPAVLSVQKDHVVKTTMTEANELTGANDVHDLGITGDGLTAAVIDTGVDSAAGVVHAGLADDLLGQQCFRTEGDCIGGAGSAEDQEGHGTHVAGMITGPDGVAPDARFYALKVFTTGSTSDTNILNALNYVIGLNNTTPGTVDLVNMSLGGDSFADAASCNANNAAYLSAFATLNSQSVTTFVATGNDASIASVGAPACVDGAVGVGSTGDAAFNLTFSNCTDNGAADKVSCFSNATPVQGAGELVDLLAPGCYILSLGLNNTDGAASCGTSMATPYSVGVAALVQEYAEAHDGKLSPSALETLLEDTGKPITDYRIPAGPTYPRVAPLDAIGSLALPAPTALQVTGTTASSVSLSWVASAGADHYQFTRTAESTGTTTTIPTAGAGTTFTDSSAPCGSLTYLVRSVDAEGITSGPSNTVTTQARACPATPTNVALTKVFADEHNVTWQLPAPASSVVLQRSLAGSAFADYQTLAGTATNYQDIVGACGRVEYRVLTVAANLDRSPPSVVVGRALCAPANDDLVDAEVVTVGAVATTVTDTEANAKYASVEGADPAYSCHFGGAAKGFDGVWYKIVPAANSRVTVSTATSTIVDPAAGAPDTLVAIYKGTPSLANEVACNDDISGSNFRSTATSNLLAGNTYWVHVSQWTDVPDSASGSLITTFTWAAAILPPANDDFADAAVIGASPFNLSVASAQTATTQPTDPAHPSACIYNLGAARVGTHTLWWKFTPEVGGQLDLDTLSSSGSFTDTLLSVLTGSPGSFTNIACNDDTSGSQFRSTLNDVPLNGGTTYYVLVSRWSATPTTTAGTVVLNGAFTATPGVTLSTSAVAVEEGRPGATYTARLNTQPTANVTITPSGNADCSVSGPMVFSTANWATPQTVTVTAVDDGLTEPEQTCPITHAATSTDGTYNGISIGSVTGTVTDKLVATITVTRPTEGQQFVKDSVFTGEFECSDNRGGAGIASCVGTTPDGSPLDTSTVGDHDFTVTATDIYGATTVETNTYTVTEVPALVLSKTTVAIEEGQGTDSYTARLSTAPLSDVTVTVTGNADCSVTPATLTFTVANFAVPQTVQVISFDDSTAEPTETCPITHTLASTDDRFDGLASPTVTGTVTDKLVRSVSITSPADGASFTQNAVVNADFACTDNRAGAGIVSCVGTVADGSPIDTATLGARTFTVTLTDVHGATVTEIASYTVTAPPTPTTTGKPDARITQPAPVVGDNVYGGTKQKKKVKAAVKSKVTYVVSLQNDGTGADKLKVLGSPKAKGFKVKYVGPDGTNITAAVVAGTFQTPTLAKNATYDIKVIVKVTTKAEKKLKVSVLATSVATPAASDVVFLLTKRL